MLKPWLEKYRPKSLNEVVGNSETISKLKSFSVSGNIPNMLFAGPAGVGKTTSIHCLVKKLLGAHYKNAVLELNASDERGIDVVRNKIKTFAQTTVTLPVGLHKIIILDEADNVTASAQNALRRTMELYSNTTRFILSCNISSKVIEAIQSRCAVLRFSQLENSDIRSRLINILEREKIDSFSDDGINAILFLAEGDLRNAINSLQATFSGFGNITAENVYKVCDVPHPLVLKEILTLCNKTNVREAIKQINALSRKGYMTIDIISTLFRVSKTHEELGETKRLEYLKTIGFAHMRALEGADSLLQLNGLIAQLCSVDFAIKK